MSNLLAKKMKFTDVIGWKRGRILSISQYSCIYSVQFAVIIFTDTMKATPDDILLSGFNPFDGSYYHLQQTFDHRVIQLLAEILLLNVTIVKNPLITDIATYSRDPDYWIIEQIVSGNAEMSSSTVVLTPSSRQEIAYSFAIDTFRPQLYYKAKSLRESYNIYLKPFSPKLWTCLMATAALLTAGLIFILSREAKLPHEISYDVLARIIDIQQDQGEESPQGVQNTPKEVLLQKEKWELGEILLVCLGAICQQGSARDPSTNAARLLLLVLFVLAVVGYTAYCASIISLVSLYPSTDHEQLQDIKYFTRQFSILLYDANQIKNLRLDFTETEQTNLKKGFDRALKGEAVFAGDRDVSLTFVNRQNYSPDLRCMLGRASLGMGFPKVLAVNNKSEYKDKINYNILHLRQFGLLHREKKRIFNVKLPCSTRERLSHTNYVSFKREDVAPAVAVFKLGVLTSLLLLVLENIVFSCSNEIKSFWRKRPTEKQCTTTKRRPHFIKFTRARERIHIEKF